MKHLAGLCAASLSGFRELFTGLMGKSPAKYLNEYRLTMAKSELEIPGKKIAAIALDNGFQTISCFNRACKKAAGRSPREWRKKGA